MDPDELSFLVELQLHSVLPILGLLVSVLKTDISDAKNRTPKPMV